MSKFPLLDRRGRRERLSLIASGGVVDKLMLAQRSLLLRCLIYHPVCAGKERGLFLYGAATPPVQEGKFAGQHIFVSITRQKKSPSRSCRRPARYRYESRHDGLGRSDRL